MPSSALPRGVQAVLVTSGQLRQLDPLLQMFNDQDLGFFTNFLGIFIFVLAMAYHFVMADPKYEGN
nr:dolichyl-diphosphooligosaccharide--protein glycosyltransferase subunit 4A-like isoform X3 [Lolium perenne]